MGTVMVMVLRRASNSIMAERTVIDCLSPSALLRLLAWMSPAFPVGTFAYSGGLEQAVADGLVSDRQSLESWIEVSLDHGTLRSDAILLAVAHAAADDADSLHEVAALALALAGSRERHAELTTLGASFVKAASAWEHEVFSRLPPVVPYPVAVGAVAGAHGVPAQFVVLALLQAYVAHLGSVAIRLGLLGQTAAVSLQAGFEHTLAERARVLSDCDLDDLGQASMIADIASLRHETQEPRLFRS